MVSAITFVEEIEASIRRPRRKLVMTYIGASDDIEIYAGSKKNRKGFECRITFLS